MSELAKLDGSLIVERTKGEVSSRCDMEAANILTLNMMHEIVAGKLNGEEARKLFSEVSSAYSLSRPDPYVEALQFDVPRGGTVRLSASHLESKWCLKRSMSSVTSISERGSSQWR